MRIQIVLLMMMPLITSCIGGIKEDEKSNKNTSLDSFGAEKTSFQKIFNTADSLKVKDINGLWVDLPYAFYYTFLKYTADKEIILDYISNYPTRLPDISDTQFYETDSIKLFENMELISTDYPEIRKQLDFFYEIENIGTLKYYQCAKYPNSHIIIYDSASGTIYHFFEKYWD